MTVAIVLGSLLLAALIISPAVYEIRKDNIKNNVVRSVNIPSPVPIPVHIPMEAMTTPTSYQVPYWLGGFAVTTPSPATWVLPLTYNSGGKVQPGEFLQIRNYGPGSITLQTTSPETIDFGSSYVITSGSIVKILSNYPNWVLTSPFSVGNVTCGTGLNCAGNQVGLSTYGTPTNCAWPSTSTDPYGRSIITCNTPPLTSVDAGVGLYATSGAPRINSYFSSVIDYGAVGDGVHDDTAAITAALADAATGSKRLIAVLLPSGNYKVSSSIVVPSGVQFIGSGTTSVITPTSSFHVLMPRVGSKVASMTLNCSAVSGFSAGCLVYYGAYMYPRGKYDYYAKTTFDDMYIFGDNSAGVGIYLYNDNSATSLVQFVRGSNSKVVGFNTSVWLRPYFGPSPPAGNYINGNVFESLFLDTPLWGVVLGPSNTSAPCSSNSFTNLMLEATPYTSPASTMPALAFYGAGSNYVAGKIFDSAASPMVVLDSGTIGNMVLLYNYVAYASVSDLGTNNLIQCPTFGFNQFFVQGPVSILSTLSVTSTIQSLSSATGAFTAPSGGLSVGGQIQTLSTSAAAFTSPSGGINVGGTIRSNSASTSALFASAGGINAVGTIQTSSSSLNAILAVNGGMNCTLDAYFRHPFSQSTPTVTAALGAGTSPTVSIAGKDSRWQVTLTTGTGATSTTTDVFTLFYGVNWTPGAAYGACSPSNALTAALTNVFIRTTTSSRILTATGLASSSGPYVWECT